VQTELGKLLIVPKPELPVELLDTLVSRLDALVDRGEAHVRSVLEREVKGDRRAASLLEHGEGDDVGGGVKGELDGLEVGGVGTKGPGASVEDDGRGLIAGGGNDDSLVGSRGEKASHRVGDVGGALDEVDRGKEGSEPANLGTGEGLEPSVDRGKGRGFSELVDGLAGLGRDLDARERSGRDDRLLSSDVVDSRDLGLVSAVVSVEQFLGEPGLDAAEELLDRLVGSSAVLDGDGSLENADSLGVGIEDGVDVLGGPERVLKGSKGEWGSGRQHRNEQNGLKAKGSRRTFLNQTSNEASRTGMKGTGFWAGRWEMLRKKALSSAARSWFRAAG
jgi:hypothetical protein